MTESENPGITTEQQITAQLKTYPQAHSRGTEREENEIRRETDMLI